MDDGDKHGGSDSDGCGKNSTWEVGSKSTGKNQYGLYDMAGNVWEWVSDNYDKNYYKTSPKNNPKGASTSASRVLRGGGWFNISALLRSFSRYRYNPTAMDDDRGFRCVKSQ